MRQGAPPPLLQSRPQTQLKRQGRGRQGATITQTGKVFNFTHNSFAILKTHHNVLLLTSRTLGDFELTCRGRHDLDLHLGVQRGVPPGAPSRTPLRRPGQTGLRAQPRASQLWRLGLGES